MNTYLKIFVLLMTCNQIASKGLHDILSELHIDPSLSFHEYDALYNVGYVFSPRLRLGQASDSEHVTFVEELEGSRFGCRKQGVLKITLSNSTLESSRGRVLIDMLFSSPTDNVFHIGDSRGNDGSGDDDGTQSNDAEVVGDSTNFKIFLKDEEEGFSNDNTLVDIDNLYRKRLTILIGNEEVTWLSDNDEFDKFNYYRNPGLFALADQFDTEGDENFDIYVGINRVIQAGTVKTGSGLCSIGVKFLPVIN